MHQPDKKKIEELKNISLGIDAIPPQPSKKSFSQAQSFFKGMVGQLIDKYSVIANCSVREVIDNIALLFYIDLEVTVK